jgi:hypothetical protein
MLVTSLNNFIRAVAPYGELDPNLAPQDVEVLTGYIADTRQPAWARLAIALLANDVDNALDLCEAAQALAAVDGLTRVRAGRAAFNALGAVPRAHLLSTYTVTVSGSKRHLSLADFGEVTGDPSFTDFVSLIGQIDWANTSLDEAIDTIDGDSWLLDLWEQRAMLCDWASCTDAIDGGDPVVLENIAEALAIGPRVDAHSHKKRSLSDLRITTSLDDALFTALLTENLVATGTPGSLRLLGVLLNSRPRPTEQMLVTASVSPESAWVLANGYKCSHVGLAAKARLIAAVSDAPDHDHDVVLALLAQLANHQSEDWVTMAWSTDLGYMADLVAAAVAKKLARSYGYTLESHDFEYAKALPAGVTERIMTLKGAVVNRLITSGLTEGARPDEEVTRAFALNSETIDQARAVLYELGYTPTQCLVPPGEYFLVNTLRSGLLDEARHPDNAELSQRNARWLRCLSAPAAVALSRQSAEYNAKCKASSTLVCSLQTLLDEALTHAGTPQGRSCLIEAITTAENAYLPTSQSLAAYADSVAKVIDHQA